MGTLKTDIAFIVSSCDKYEDAWYPYFELIKKYWPDHPAKIYLITEEKKYQTEGLDIVVCYYGNGLTWSERLYNTLKIIESKYVIFSLEDFFLLDYVKQDRIEECYNWMEENPDIAVCRLCSSDNANLKPIAGYKDFYVADSTVDYRLDTQVALWNRETLMSFIDLSESPWQFEAQGTKRIMASDKIFLWHKSDDLYKMEDKIFPYRIYQPYGYGIAWGHWLWNDKKWFRENGIRGVKFRLGILSERTVRLRFKYLYCCKNPSIFVKIIKPFWRGIIKLRKIKANIAVFGLNKGLKVSLKENKNKNNKTTSKKT